MPDPQSYQSIGWLIVCLAALVAAINQFDGFIKRRSGKGEELNVGPNPLVVRAERDYVSRDELDSKLGEIRKDRDQLHAKMGGIERSLREELKAEVRDLHEKVNATNLAVARVETECRAQTAMLGQLRDELRDLLHAQRPPL